MKRVNARPVSAEVVQVHPIFDRSMESEVGVAMRVECASILAQLSVVSGAFTAPAARRPKPLPTAGRLDGDFLPEPLDRRLAVGASFSDRHAESPFFEGAPHTNLRLSSQ